LVQEKKKDAIHGLKYLKLVY